MDKIKKRSTKEGLEFKNDNKERIGAPCHPSYSPYTLSHIKLTFNSCSSKFWAISNLFPNNANLICLFDTIAFLIAIGIYSSICPRFVKSHTMTTAS